MTWGGNSVVQVLIIQGNQAISGLFLYNGIGGPGNPPQFAAVASSVTQDPFGNAIGLSKILIQGNVITESGGIFRTAAAAPLMQLDGPHNAFLAYDAASVLRETIAPVATTDGLGSNVQAGFATYGSANTIWGRLFQAILGFNQTADTIGGLLTENSDGSITLQSAAQAATPVQSVQSWNPAAAGTAALSRLSAALDLIDVVQPPQQTGGNKGPALWGNSGICNVVDGNDGNNYDVERLTLICATTTINSSTVRVNVFSHHLGVGTYKIRIWMVTQNTTAADAAAWSFAFSGTLAGSGNLVDFESKTTGTATVGYAASSTATTTFNGQGVAGNQQLLAQATLVVTAAGTLTFGGLELVNGNTVTVSAGGQMDIYPVVAT